MFNGATAFNWDMSLWDVTSGTTVNNMFSGATAFAKTLCSASWIGKIALLLSGGALNRLGDSVCSAVPTYTTKADLVAAVKTCLTASPVGVCTPAMNTWDVSAITDISSLFYATSSFNSDNSNLKVGAVTTMYKIFDTASAFNSDISRWDVSNVINIGKMFRQTTFNMDIFA